MPFNSREYEWSDLTLILGGRDITGIRAIKYKEKMEAESVYGKGRLPHSVQTGNISYEGEVTLLQSEYESLVKAGNGSVLNLRGLIASVTYGGSGLDALITDNVEGIVITEGGKEWKQGDKFIEITLPFVATKVKNQRS